MYSYVALVCFVLALTGADGLFAGRSGGRLMTQCRSRFRPCRMQVTMRHFNGTFAGSMQSEGCRCSRGRPCPADWSDSNYVVSRSLISDTYNMTMNMMFCRRVIPHRRCQMGESALVLSGVLHIPTTIEEYTCRCSVEQPLQLKRRWIDSSHQFFHAYVCADHQPTCTSYYANCMMMGANWVDYNCKCPRSQFCRENWDEEDPIDPDLVMGNCRS